MRKATDTARSVVNQYTLTPLRNLVFAISVSAGATWWAATIANRLERIEASLTAAAHDKVSTQDMKLWLIKLERENPTIKLPEWVGQ